MLNIVWFSLIIIAVIVGILNGHVAEVVASVTESAKYAFQIVLSLIGILCFWLGLMRIAESAGLIRRLSALIRPVMQWLFPDVPVDHPAMGAMTMNIAANMLGLGNAATPFGLRAMQLLSTLNQEPETATNAMCMFLALNTSSVQLIPATAIAYLVAGGAKHPTSIILSSLVATTCSTLVAIIAAKSFEKIKQFKIGAAT